MKDDRGDNDLEVVIDKLTKLEINIKNKSIKAITIDLILLFKFRKYKSDFFICSILILC